MAQLCTPVILKNYSCSQGILLVTLCKLMVLIDVFSLLPTRYTKLKSLLFIFIYYYTINYITPQIELEFNLMEPDFQDVAQQCGQPEKKVKLDKEILQGEKALEEEDQWVVVKSKYQDLSISICDFSKVNRYYSHRSLQGYIRYLLSQSVPNPMWLSIKRQSLIQQILYIDLEIESNLFESLLANKQLSFLSSVINQSNKALFKFNSKILRQDLWQVLLCCQMDQNIKEIKSQSFGQLPKTLNEELYKKYRSFILTPEQLKLHLYPNKDLPLYSDFYVLKNLHQNKPQQKNKILIIDCQMVVSQAGFELARATIVNFQGEIIFDSLFQPFVQIINYNTQYSGITQEMLEKVTFTQQNTLYPFLESIVCEDTIMVGHSLENDLRAMKITFQRVIDSAVLFATKSGSKFKLKSLADKILKRKIQIGEHDSKQDCLATLDIVRSKVESDSIMIKKEYKVLKQIQDVKKSVAIIDYAIDYEMKSFQGNHYEKTQKYQHSTNMFKIVKKYLKKGIAIPSLIMTRIEKIETQEWQNYYQQFDKSFKEFYSTIPKKTAIFLNCQINPTISIITKGQPLKLSSSIRNPCFMLAV